MPRGTSDKLATTEQSHREFRVRTLHYKLLIAYATTALRAIKGGPLSSPGTADTRSINNERTNGINQPGANDDRGDRLPESIKIEFVDSGRQEEEEEEKPGREVAARNPCVSLRD